MQKYKELESPTLKTQNSLPKGLGNNVKCYPLFFGGTDMDVGYARGSLNPKACDKLRCI